MTDFKKTIDLLGDDRSSARSSLYNCRDKKYRLQTAVDDLHQDLYRCERQLERAYRRHVMENINAKKAMKVIGDYKIYPKGVRHGNFPLYTEEGERFMPEKPAAGNVRDQFHIADSGNHLRYYSVV